MTPVSEKSSSGQNNDDEPDLLDIEPTELLTDSDESEFEGNRSFKILLDIKAIFLLENSKLRYV